MSVQKTEPFKIVDNVYYVGLETVGSYLIPTSEGLILLDATYADTADLVLDSVRALGSWVRSASTRIWLASVEFAFADGAGC